MATIRHVFVLVLENRSFDHLLGMSTGTGTDARTGEPTTVDGPAGQTTTGHGQESAGRAGAPFVLPADPPHEFCDVLLHLPGHPAAGCDVSAGYPPLTLSGYVDNYASEPDAGADPGAVMACL